ncbi:tape measure protein [Methylopila sp. 73B]|uniref:tape measure protein n=1 Tax=Methylopila sp. 73B TaxID=1120792 RepID=UPI00036AC765|nr:tape measure protein [Methylopila sp. 73B]
MAQSLDALIVELRADIKGFQASLATATGDIQRFSGSSTKHIGGIQAAIERARMAVVAFGGAWAAFSIGKGIIDAGVQVEALRNKMIAATGSTTVAADALAFIRAEADRLGLSIQVASDGFAGFAASSLRAGLTLDETKQIFTGVSEAAVSMRLSAEQTGLVFKALEQIAGKGTVSMEELRGQLGDSGLSGAFEIAAKSMGKTTAEFTKMVSNGEVMSADFLPKFAAQIRKDLGGSVEEASQGAQAAFNRLGNAFFDLQTKLAASGLLDVVVRSIKDLTDALNDPGLISGLSSFVQLLSNVLNIALRVAGAIGTAVSAINSATEAVGNSIFGGLFGKEGTDAINKARGARNQAAATVGATPTAAPVASSYTLGTKAVALPNAGAARKAKTAADRAARERESLSGRVDSVYAANSNDTDRMRLAYAEDQKILEEALEKKAITQQRYNEVMSRIEIEFDKSMNDYRVDKFGTDIEQEQERFEERKELLLQGLDDRLITVQEHHELLEEAEREHNERMLELQNQANEDRLTEAQRGLQGFLGVQLAYQQKSAAQEGASFRNSLQQLAQHNKTAFMVEKAAALAQALISARQSVVDAYKFGNKIGGPALGATFAAVAAAAQAANIAAIASTSYGGGGGSVGASGGGGGGSGGMPSPAEAETPSKDAVQRSVYITVNGDEDTLLSKRTVRKLIDQLNDAFGDGSQLKVAFA